MKKSKYVIAGNSAAAVAAIESIRKVDREGEITVISKEPYLSYSRPLVTYLLAGVVNENKMLYRDKEFYKKFEVELTLGEEAVDISPERKIVKLSNGEEIMYEKLLIATGGTPIFPATKGNNLRGVFTFTSWDDAKRVDEYIKTENVEYAVVVGGGLIGLKTSEALIARKIKLTIIELADRVLSATFDRKASDLVEKKLKEVGCEIRAKTTVGEILGKEKVEGVVLQDGTRLDCQMVIFAIGVRPNSEIAKNAGLKVNKGIITDGRMRTSAPDIYAAGDVAEAYDSLLGVNRQIAIWPTAYWQGAIAGANMTGKDERYGGAFAMNSVEICGLPTISVGITDPKDPGYEILERYNGEKLVYKKIVLRDDKVVGAIFIGKIDRAGIFTNMIKEKIDVGTFKNSLLNDDFGLAWFPKEFRKHMVVGEGIEI